MVYYDIMKFLLEYVICCTSSSSASPSSRTDDSRSLVPVLPPENRHYRDRRKCRLSASKSVKSDSEADWQPSLNSISEDDVSVERRKRATTGSERSAKQKASPATKSHVRNRRSDDYGSPIPGMIPAFSPTPFLF